MKILPKRLSEELLLKIDYLICRFMKSKVAFKIEQDQKGTWFSIKKIQEKNLHPQYHFHIRFDGVDKWNKKEDVIDFDFYISEEEFNKITQLK